MDSDRGAAQHEALDALWVGIMRKKVNWVLDADIRGFFDIFFARMDDEVLEHRIADRRMLRLIRKWLRAGVLEDGGWSETEEGDSARFGDFTALRECLLARCLRPVGAAVADAARER